MRIAGRSCSYTNCAFADIAQAARQANVVPQLLPIEVPDQRGGTTSIAAKLATDQSTDNLIDTYEAAEDDVAMILYTSGTTGRAKGAMISYRQIHWNAVNTTIGLQLTQNDVALLNMPLYHIGGWHVLFTPLMQLGGRVILQKTVRRRAMQRTDRRRGCHDPARRSHHAADDEPSAQLRGHRFFAQSVSPYLGASLARCRSSKLINSGEWRCGKVTG